MCVVRVYWCACHVLVFVSECVFVKICWYLCMYGTDYVDVWKWSSCMLSVRPTGVSGEGGCVLARLPLASAPVAVCSFLPLTVLVMLPVPCCSRYVRFGYVYVCVFVAGTGLLWRSRRQPGDCRRRRITTGTIGPLHAAAL